LVDTTLHVAVREGRKAVVEYLLDNGVSVNAKNAQGYTALHVAAEASSMAHCDVATMLLARGADVHAVRHLRRCACRCLSLCVAA
jgi:ankyrin repeat protein